MKKLVTIILMLLLVTGISAQNKTTKAKDTLYINQVYKDASKLVMAEKVIQFDNINRAELQQRFKNWGGKYFKNFNNVVTSTTDSQITLRYVLYDYYFIMTVEFKDNKIRVTTQEDGYTKGASSITPLHFYEKFQNDMFVYKTKENAWNFDLGFALTALECKKNIDDSINKIDEYLRAAPAKSDF
jgi:hypothetical protein